MKQTLILLCAIMICGIHAKVFTSAERIGKTKCYVRINPTKGLIDVGPCPITAIRFYDIDMMWLGTYESTLEAHHSYRNIWFSSISYIEDTHKIIADFDYDDNTNSGNYTIGDAYESSCPGAWLTSSGHCRW